MYKILSIEQFVEKVTKIGLMTKNRPYDMIMITKETKETSSSELSPPLRNITGTHISTTTTSNIKCAVSYFYYKTTTS